VAFKDGSIFVNGNRKPVYQEATAATDNDMHPMDIDPQTSQGRVREIRYGPFHRRIKLPEGIKASQVSAKISDGMLKVTWPRSPVPDDPQDETASVKTESDSPCSSPRSRSPDRQLPSTDLEATLQ
jgi:hypothetical protein